MEEDSVIIDEICIPGRNVQCFEVQVLGLSVATVAGTQRSEQGVRFPQIPIQFDAPLQQTDCFLCQATLAVN